MRRNLLVGAVLATAVLHGTPASARSVHDEPYPYETTWNAAIRMVRVDLGCVITERDQEAGYFTFTYRDSGRAVPGSIEIVRTDVEGRNGARVIVQIPEMPTYVEAMFLTRLGRKLHTEFGDPPPLPRRSPPTPPVDGGHPDEHPPGGSPTSPDAPHGGTPTQPSADPPTNPPTDHERTPQSSTPPSARYARETC